MTEQTIQNTNIKNNHAGKKYLVVFIILIAFITAIILAKYFWQHFNSPQDKFTQEQQVVAPAAPTQATIEHLIRMADLSLNTSNDIKTALTFLLAAKKYAGDTNYALNKDIASLQAAAVIDTEELVLKIDAISQQVNTLVATPLKTTFNTPDAAINNNAATQFKYPHLLNQFFASVIQSLKNIVIIRHQSVEPMLQPEQAVFLRFNIQAKLLQAELAVMQRQNKLYQTSLAQVINLITKFFICNNTTATNILSTLQELQQINLSPDLPLLTSVEH